MCSLLHKLVFEIQIKGMPNEIECLNRLREHMGYTSKCLGSSTAYACFYKDVIIKVTPRVEETAQRGPQHIPLYTPLQQTLSLFLVIEGINVGEIAEVAENVYAFVRNCGLSIRFIG